MSVVGRTLVARHQLGHPLGATRLPDHPRTVDRVMRGCLSCAQQPAALWDRRGRCGADEVDEDSLTDPVTSNALADVVQQGAANHLVGSIGMALQQRAGDANGVVAVARVHAQVQAPFGLRQ